MHFPALSRRSNALRELESAGPANSVVLVLLFAVFRPLRQAKTTACLVFVCVDLGPLVLCDVTMRFKKSRFYLDFSII